jgi:large subunit ribosomal protein L23
VASPNDTVILLRTDYLGPRYASFAVPLHFNKLHLKAYLKDIYNVDVLHIRSVVKQEKVQRQEGRDPYSQGPLVRPQSTKKMTCLLAKPFVYPTAPENLDA